MAQDQTLPRVVRPAVGGVNLLDWAAENRPSLRRELAEHGAILCRGFALDSVEELERFVTAFSGAPLPYTERSSPRSQLGGRVYTSTDYPPQHPIFLHNEQSYNRTFPLRIFFCCLEPAAQGGATPLADCRRLYQRIDPEIRRRFIDRRYTYCRNFGSGPGLSWQEAFQTDQRPAVEEYCRANDIRFEWRGGDALRTRQVRRAVAQHPESGALSWFNHATFFHVSTLVPEVRDSLLEQLPEEDLPNNTYYGDGAAIEPDVLDHLRSAYRQETVRFEWERGDLLVVDNMLVAHGRDPFAGSRTVAVGMAEAHSWADIPEVAPPS